MAAVAQVELEVITEGGVGQMYGTPYGLGKLVERRADGIAELRLPYGTLYAQSDVLPSGQGQNGGVTGGFFFVGGDGEGGKNAANGDFAGGIERKRAASTPGKEILIGGVKCRTVNDEHFSRVRTHFGIPNDFADTAAKFDFKKLAPAGGKGGDPMARTVDKAFFIKEVRCFRSLEGRTVTVAARARAVNSTSIDSLDAPTTSVQQGRQRDPDRYRQGAR